MDPYAEAIRAWIATKDVEDIVGAEDQAKLLELVPLPELRPHVVKVAREKHPDRIGEAPHCPDCGRGLTSRGDDLICARLPLTTELRGDEAKGRVVACGEGLTDG